MNPGPANRGPGEAAPNSAEALFAGDRAAQALGITLLAVEEGRAATTMRVVETMVNGHGVAHGGCLFLLADTAFACACNSHGQTALAAGADIIFITPARLGDELVAIATERSRSGRNGIYDVSVHRLSPDGHDVTIAEFRGRSRTLNPGPTRSGSRVEGSDASS